MPTPRNNYRSLAALSKTASTSRVLNLAAVAAKNGNEPDYGEKPFFACAALNTCVIIKHAVRAHEREDFQSPPYIATKVFLPFERSSLELGGRSVFVGQRNWTDGLSALCPQAGDFQRDSALLEALDELPSLDPFLIREHLSRRGFSIGPSYFDISQADVDRMQRFVGEEIGKLIQLAFKGAEGKSDSTARLVEVLLTNQPDARLEPLRLTLRLEGEAYREGIFAWKGFLYYKWVLSTLMSRIAAVAGAIQKLRPVGPCTSEQSAEIEQCKQRLRKDVESSTRVAMKTLGVYDEAYLQLTHNSDPGSFRDFLLKSPEMFVSLGESVGGVSHITSYWEYRFPRDRVPRAPAEEVLEILTEFDGSIGSSAGNQAAAA